MLQAWLPPPWALLGGVLAILRISLFSYWIDTYSGAGSIACLGAALVLGALPRITRRGARPRDCLLLATGIAILGLSRPFEGLLLCLPFIPFIMLAVRLSSPGPIFFRQTRVGRHGRPFSLIKFRTMRDDAEADGAIWATANDSRVTPLGRFLRKSRLDEIPQLWNVLKGEMSFVGPRPERPEFVGWLAKEIPFYELRHMVRPGITGWAQVRYHYGASLEEAKRKLEYDLYYVKHLSLGLDLLIMFETIKIIMLGRGAR